MICLAQRQDPTEAIEGIYQLGLSDLSMEQIGRLMLMVPREADSWPNPAQLRRWLGLPAIEEQQEQEAGAVLREILEVIQGESLAFDSARRQAWLAGARSHASGRKWRALAIFGGGSVTSGIELLCLHPRFLRQEDRREVLGLELNSIERLERRWLAAWREAGQR